MKDTLQFLVEKIVDHPEEVTIEETAEQDKILLVIHAHKDDIGKIIGKSGRIIKALRDLMKLIATKQHAYVDVILAEDQEQ